MINQPGRDEDPPPTWPQGVVMAQQRGVRVFWLQADHMQGLVDRLALVLGEHMHPGDDLHVTYNAMQSGWQQHPPFRGSLIKPAREGWTELLFEYSAFVVLRGRP